MNFEKPKISIKNEKSKTPRTIKDIEDTLKEMDRIHNTSFYGWIKDENNASVIALKTKDMFQEYYEKQPELVYNALRFLCKDWKLSKIAELILKLFYKCNIASQKLAIIIYEVSLLLENPEKVDLISLLLIGEEAKNVAFFLYHFFQYTGKKYREHEKTLNEEEFLDEMNAFCSGMLECLYSILKWNDDYFKELILEYINLSTLKIDARREFLVHMVNVKYSRFHQEMENKKESIQCKDDDKINSTKDINENESSKVNKMDINDKDEDKDEVFKKSVNFGILVFNMFQMVMRTDVDELFTVDSPNEEISNIDKTSENDDIDDDMLSETSMSIYDNSKIIMLKKDDSEGNMTMSNTENDLSNISMIKKKDEHMKKEESSATLWMDDNEGCSSIINESFDNNEGNTSKDLSSIYNFGYDSSYCKNNNESSCYTNENENFSSIEESSSSDNNLDEFSYHFEELFNESFSLCDDDNEDFNDVSLLDDFINKSFTSTTSSSARRNSTLSFASFISDSNNLEEGSKTNSIMDGSSSRRNSRYSLNLSMTPMPSCLNNSDDNEERLTHLNNVNSNSSNNYYHNNHSSSCSCNCNCIYNNYSNNLHYIFPSPPNSPAIASAPQSPNFLLNDREFEYNSNYNHNNHDNSNKNSCNTNNNNESDDGINHSNFRSMSDSHINENNNGSSDSCDSSSNNLYRSFSPEMSSPSPIVQSLSVDNIFSNNYGYSCTFNHVNSTPSLNTTRND